MSTDEQVKALAQQLYDALVTDTRNDGTKFIKTRDGSPGWMQRACRAAHGSLFPDDYRYAFILESAELIASAEDPDEASHEMEADVFYNSALMKWASSSLRRPFYADEATEEYGGEPGGIYAQLALGQVAEKHETYELLLAALREIADELGDDELGDE